jgi:hypothetical protein
VSFLRARVSSAAARKNSAERSERSLSMNEWQFCEEKRHNRTLVGSPDDVNGCAVSHFCLRIYKLRHESAPADWIASESPHMNPAGTSPFLPPGRRPTPSSVASRAPRTAGRSPFSGPFASAIEEGRRPDETCGPLHPEYRSTL